VNASARGARERIARQAITEVMLRRKLPAPSAAQTDALVSLLLAKGTEPPP
jgi:hypothetical protein